MTPREIDELVAEKVMGWKSRPTDRDPSVLVWETGTGWCPLPNFSTTGDGALLVIGAMKAKGWELSKLNRDSTGTPSEGYIAYFSTKEGRFSGHSHKTIPMTVSLAALRAFEVEV